MSSRLAGDGSSRTLEQTSSEQIYPPDSRGVKRADRILRYTLLALGES